VIIIHHRLLITESTKIKVYILEIGVQTGTVMSMPVPSSFNDITTDKSLQNFVGWVWYDRAFYVASEWKNKRIVLRIDSAHYTAIVVGPVLLCSGIC